MTEYRKTIALEEANAVFWNEQCGTGLAQHLGITDHSLKSLNRLDDYCLDIYPYLPQHVPIQTMKGKRVLEIGLGYGTLGQKIAEVSRIKSASTSRKGR